MPGRSRPVIWASAAAIGLFQLVGSFGAASDPGERKGMVAVQPEHTLAVAGTTTPRQGTFR